MAKAAVGCTVHQSQRRLRPVVYCSNTCADMRKGVPQHSVSSRFPGCSACFSARGPHPEPRWQQAGVAVPAVPSAVPTAGGAGRWEERTSPGAGNAGGCRSRHGPAAQPSTSTSPEKHAKQTSQEHFEYIWRFFFLP